METRSTKGFRQRVLRHLWKSLIFIISALLHRKVILKRCNKWLSQHFSSHLPPTDSSNGYIILKTITSLVRFPWQNPEHQKTHENHLKWATAPLQKNYPTTYCWYLKSCTTKDDDYPIVNRVFNHPRWLFGISSINSSHSFQKILCSLPFCVGLFFPTNHTHVEHRETMRCTPFQAPGYCGHNFSSWRRCGVVLYLVCGSWWFQPIWKILVKMGNLPQIRVKTKNIWNHHLEGDWSVVRYMNLLKKIIKEITLFIYLGWS